MDKLIQEIQNVLNDYWETFQERDNADYALNKIQDILSKYDKEANN